MAKHSKEYYTKWREKNPDKVLAAQRRYQAKPETREKQRVARKLAHEKDGGRAIKSSKIKHRYGITLAQKEEMLFEQGYVCAICGSGSPKGTRDWDVDHCHKTGRVRGLLCRSCNLALGNAEDSPEMLRKMADYLERTSAL